MDKIVDVIGKVKNLKRTGWIKRNVENGESVADHTFGLMMLAYLFCPPHLNRQRCLELGLVHDLAEVITGDFTPCDNVPPEEKYGNELKAIKEIADNLEKPEIVDLFIEFETAKTPESVFMKEMDKIEAVAQAKFYDNNKNITFYKEHNTDWDSLLTEFYQGAENKVDSLKHIFEKLK